MTLADKCEAMARDEIDWFRLVKEIRLQFGRSDAAMAKGLFQAQENVLTSLLRQAAAELRAQGEGVSGDMDSALREAHRRSVVMVEPPHMNEPEE